MNVRHSAFRPVIIPFVVVAAGLVAAGCSKKEEPQLSTTTETSGPSGATGAGAPPSSEWAWADEPSAPPPAAPPPVAEEPSSRPIDQPPTRVEPPPPRTQPRREPSSGATNRLSPPEERPAPEPEPAPVRVSYIAPAGAQATFRLDNQISSESATVGEPVTATLAADITDGAGHVVLPAGTRLSGTVTEAVAAKKAKKKSFLAYSLTRAELPDGTVTNVSLGQKVEGKGWTGKDGAIIGGSAAGGALLGQILGHDTKSTAAGAVIGGAIGSGVAMSKKGEDVTIAAGEEVTLPLGTTVTVERMEPARRVTVSD